MRFENSLAFAQQLDAQSPLKNYRSLFHYPQQANGQPTIYFCGNSLGLQPKSVASYINQELQDWATFGVEGHFEAQRPWFKYHHFLTQATANLVGALPDEVVVMNALTVNLHLLLISFYRPTAQRYKIIIEGGAFPSDRYAVASHARLHGLDPQTVVVELFPRQKDYTLQTDDILKVIETIGHETALVLLGGVQYYTGQFFDLKTITEAAHNAGAIAGFDLAHAAGNVILNLHEWQVDFAAWCGYKYLNSGPGGSSGVFVHQKHGQNPDLLRLAGWWGNSEQTRFEMPHDFIPQQGATGWQLSNAQVLNMAAHMASLEIFEQVGMAALRQKSEQLTGFAEFLIDSLNNKLQKNIFNIITPRAVHQRGCQLSILSENIDGRAVFEFLKQHGVILDWRHPNVMRIAPVPLYNTFEEVFRFVTLLEDAYHNQMKDE